MSSKSKIRNHGKTVTCPKNAFALAGMCCVVAPTLDVTLALATAPGAYMLASATASAPRGAQFFLHLPRVRCNATPLG